MLLFVSNKEQQAIRDGIKKAIHVPMASQDDVSPTSKDLMRVWPLHTSYWFIPLKDGGVAKAITEANYGPYITKEGEIIETARDERSDGSPRLYSTSIVGEWSVDTYVKINSYYSSRLDDLTIKQWQTLGYYPTGKRDSYRYCQGVTVHKAVDPIMLKEPYLDDYGGKNKQRKHVAAARYGSVWILNIETVPTP